MKRTLVLFALAFTLTLGLAATTFAQSGVDFWMGAAVGYNGYKMSDVNDEINAIADIAALSADEINAGFGAQGELGVRINSRWLLGMGIKRLSGSSMLSDMYSSLEYSFPANAYYGLAGVSLPASDVINYGAIASIGSINSAGKITIGELGYGSLSADVEGNGTFFEGKAFFSLEIDRHFNLVPALGYRVAKINEIKIGGGKVVKEDGSDYSLDYSGYTVQIGVMVFLSN